MSSPFLKKYILIRTSEPTYTAFILTVPTLSTNNLSLWNLDGNSVFVGLSIEHVSKQTHKQVHAL